VAAIAVAAPDGTIVAEKEGTFEGRIAEAPRGANGFGYDPIFVVAPEYTHTAAELSPEEKNARSHRGVAIQNLIPELKRLFGEVG